MKKIKVIPHNKKDKKVAGVFEDYMNYVRIDTGWDCCVCNEVARVNGDGFTWCKKHWELWDLGRKYRKDGSMITIADLRDRFKSKNK